MSDDHARTYSENPLRRKRPGLLKRAGRFVAHKVLLLYYVGRDPATPGWAKAMLVAGLASFFSIDVLLDLFALPIGLEVSLGSFLLALGALLASLRRRHFEQARARIHAWFDAETVIDVTAQPVSSPPETKPPILPET